MRYDGLHIKTNGGSQGVNLIVKPADAGPLQESGLILVIFEDLAPEAADRLPEEGNTPRRLAGRPRPSDRRSRTRAALQ